MSGEPSTTAREALRAIRELQTQIEAERRARAQLEARVPEREPIAIIGTGARYPGAPNLEAFWELLCRGGDAVGVVPAGRWDSAALFDPDPAARGKILQQRGGFLPDLDRFDAAFFGISPREAPHVDPRQRLILEASWEALEDAGLDPLATAASSTGVFMATLANDYDHLLCDELERIEAFSGSGTANSIVANRLSYFFDWHGPSLALDTACSGSLNAVLLACESLRRGECAMALAGGVNALLMPKSNVFFSRAGALSPRGECSTFAAAADGMVRSEGAGVVVLKPLSAARRDGDRIAAVILGGAMNHDGRSNGIMAPNGAAQEAVLRQAYVNAGVEPRAVQYIEAHGTATRLGDPIEAAALGAVLGPGRASGEVCRLGSLKTNIGHTEAAAGVGSLIKTALALEHGLIPPSLHFDAPNPLIPFDRLPLAVQRELGPWPRPDQPRIAGVSGFGFGGANAHVVLAAAPTLTPAASPAPPWILPVSARTPEAVTALAGAYAEALAQPGVDAGALCAAAARRRAHFSHRLAVAGQTADELRERLLAQPPLDGSAGRAADGVAWVFSGQGSHWAGMGTELLQREPAAQAVIAECDALLRAWGAEWSLTDALRGPATTSRLNETRLAQPAIFTIQVALAALWRQWGVQPRWVVGHSLGEAAAAHVAGILTLPEALAVVWHRSRLMAQVEGPGRTAAVMLAPAAAQTALAGHAGVYVAGCNSPGSCILAGEAAALDAALNELSQAGVTARLLPGIRLAFHSPYMDAPAAALAGALSDLRPRAGTIPFVSSVTGTVLPGPECDGAYWARNLRQPFQFAAATQTLLGAGCRTLIEVSPHAVLASAMGQTARAAGIETLILGSLRRDQPEREQLFTSLAALYREGQSVNWAHVYPGPAPHAVLPHYPWQRQRYWYDQLGPAHSTGTPRAHGSHPLLEARVDPANQPGVALWPGHWSAADPGYFAEHQVRGVAVVPGAAALELALACGAEAFGAAVQVEDARFEKPLVVPEENARPVQVVMAREGGTAEFQLLAQRPDKSWERCVQARLAPGGDARGVPLPGTSGLQEQPVADHYARMRTGGLDYGPQFQAITRLWRSPNPGAAVAELAERPAPGYRVHPAVLDAALQSIAAAAGYAGDYIPIGLENFQLAPAATAPRWCAAQLLETPGGDRLRADVTLYDGERHAIGHLRGVRLQRLAAASGPTLQSALLEERWEPVSAQLPAARAGERWLILGGVSPLGSSLARRLEASGREVTAADAVPPGSWHGVIHLAGLGAPAPDDASLAGQALHATCGTALTAAQALLGQPLPGGLWLVTQGALPITGEPVTRPEQAPLGGLALALAAEHPELHPACLDLDENDPHPDEAIATALASGAGEPRLGWRRGQLYAARVVPAAPALTTSPLTLRADSTYLISGGLGALGLQAALMLARHGAGHLVLTARPGTDPARAEAATRQLAVAGAQARVWALDLDDGEAIAAALSELARAPQPLRGIIHAAGVLDDGVIALQSEARFARVFAPKAWAAWHLDRGSRALPLDFFVCFSSAAALLGSGGQANYAAANAFLDSLCHARRAQGLPALSLNWGAWASAGMAAEAAVATRMAGHGVRAIEPAAGEQLLAALLASPNVPPQLGVMPADWARFASQFGGHPPAHLTRLLPAMPAATADFRATFLATWSALAPAQRPGAVQALVRRHLAAVLGSGDGASLGARQRWFDLGLDSLLSLELRNRLEAALGLTLPATVAFDYPTLETMGGFLQQTLEQMESGQPAALDTLSDTALEELLARELGAGGGA